MQITLSGYQNNRFYLDVQRRAAASGSGPGGAGQARAAFQPCALTLLAASSSFSAVSVQDDAVTLAYRGDGSLALRMQSSLNVQARCQEAALDVILPAESLGVELPADFFKDGPAQLSLEYRFETAAVSQEIEARAIRPTRKAEDILADLSEAIAGVLRRKGDKNLQILFDEEAVQALFSDPKTSRLMKEIAGLICMINSMILEGGRRERYTIEVSGKGRPYLDVQQRTQVQAEALHVRLNLVILPPGEPPAGSEPATPAA